MPQASASAGPSTVTQAASPLLLTRRRPPLLLILDDDIGAGLDGQAAKKIAANVQRAISLHDRVAEHRAMDFRRAADQQRSAFGALLCTRCNCRQQHWAPP